jgi:tetratricopeptide (TPR) repeat protein
VTRWLRHGAVFSGLWLAAAGPAAFAQKPQNPPPPPQEQEPPEEDESLKPKEYSFNPLEAAHNLKVGGYYYKKGNYKAAQRRFTEATKWDPGFAEAYLKLAETEEKLRDTKAAKAAYAKYLELAPDHKDAEAVKKKLAHK